MVLIILILATAVILRKIAEIAIMERDNGGSDVMENVSVSNK